MQGMGDREAEAKFKIDLDRVVSDPKYRREILRRLRHDNAPVHYRPASSPIRRKPVVPVPEPPKSALKKRSKTDKDPGANEDK